MAMTGIMHDLTVELGARSYPIRIGRNLLSDLSDHRERERGIGRSCAALVDEGMLGAQPEFCQEMFAELPLLAVPSGEGSKSADRLAQAWNFLASAKIDRSGFIWAVGGGVVGDLAGCAAATYLRGISFQQIPTTLLAMVDSSVGGKTGINLSAGKNLVGVFHQPEGVWIDLNLLDSLPPREFASGMAEVVKYGMLGDRSLFEDLVARKEPLSPKSEELAQYVFRCCSQKAEIVRLDEQETAQGEGGRALLNLGHTFAHAIEATAGYGEYLHGEAVSIGLVCALRLSQAGGECSGFDENELLRLLQSYHLPICLREPLQRSSLRQAMQLDKKVDRGVLRFVLMREIGNAYRTGAVSERDVDQVWESVGAT